MSYRSRILAATESPIKNRSLRVVLCDGSTAAMYSKSSNSPTTSFQWADSNLVSYLSSISPLSWSPRPSSVPFTLCDQHHKPAPQIPTMHPLLLSPTSRPRRPNYHYIFLVWVALHRSAHHSTGGLLRRPQVEFPSVVAEHVTRGFCYFTRKPSLKMILIFIIVHLKWLSINKRNFTYGGVLQSLKSTVVLLHPVAKCSLAISFPPKASLRMEQLCPNVHLSRLSKIRHRYYPSEKLTSLHRQHVRFSDRWSHQSLNHFDVYLVNNSLYWVSSWHI